MARFEDLLGHAQDVEADATATNAQAAATVSGKANLRFYITSLSYSASAAVAATVTVTVSDGTTTWVKHQIPAAALAPQEFGYGRPMMCATGANVTATLPALGAGVVGTIQLRGYFASA